MANIISIKEYRRKVTELITEIYEVGFNSVNQATLTKWVKTWREIVAIYNNMTDKQKQSEKNHEISLPTLGDSYSLSSPYSILFRVDEHPGLMQLSKDLGSRKNAEILTQIYLNGFKRDRR